MRRQRSTMSTLPVLAALSVAAAPIACGGDSAAGADALSTDTPNAGRCLSEADCTGFLPGLCQDVACDDGICKLVPKADGTLCETGDPCRHSEACHSGLCAGGALVAAECGDQECGRDVCGNSCGICLFGEVCTSRGQCEPDPTSCGEVGFEGCCTADNKVRWCGEDGRLAEVDCAERTDVGPVCGWGGDIGYWCVNAQLGSDNADFPYLCPGQDCGKDPCDGLDCGFRCGVFCGECAGDDYCNAENLCEANACGDLNFTGCCEESGVAAYCVQNAVVLDDCLANGLDACGWVGDSGFYWCNGTDSDPSGDNPRACSSFDFPRPEAPDPGPEIGPEPQPEESPEPEEDVVEVAAEVAPDAGSTDADDAPADSDADGDSDE